eukprot:Nk52_evm4s374 gene=Nk52_evmTU4s374
MKQQLFCIAALVAICMLSLDQLSVTKSVAEVKELIDEPFLVLADGRVICQLKVAVENTVFVSGISVNPAVKVFAARPSFSASRAIALNVGIIACVAKKKSAWNAKKDMKWTITVNVSKRHARKAHSLIKMESVHPVPLDVTSARITPHANLAHLNLSCIVEPVSIGVLQVISPSKESVSNARTKVAMFALQWYQMS